MYKALAIKDNLLVWSLPLLIIAALVFLAKSPVFYKHPDALSVGITLDFMITLPLVFYLVMRKKNISWIAVSPVATAGIILAGLVLPKDHQQFLTQSRVIAYSLMELLVISFFVTKTIKAKKEYNLQKEISFDFYTALGKAVGEVVPKKISNLLSTEIALFYYGLFPHKKRKLSDNEFTCHKENGTITILSVIIFMVFIETFAQHILLQLLSPAAAWILTAVSLYSLLALFGVARSLGKRPVSLSGEKLYLRYGILSETEISFTEIESVKLRPAINDLNKDVIYLSPLHKLESQNVLINLRKEGVLNGLYGRRKKFRSIAFYIDDLVRFKSQLVKNVRP